MGCHPLSIGPNNQKKVGKNVLNPYSTRVGQHAEASTLATEQECLGERVLADSHNQQLTNKEVFWAAQTDVQQTGKFFGSESTHPPNNGQATTKRQPPRPSDNLYKVQPIQQEQHLKTTNSQQGAEYTATHILEQNLQAQILNQQKPLQANQVKSQQKRKAIEKQLADKFFIPKVGQKVSFYEDFNGLKAEIFNDLGSHNSMPVYIDVDFKQNIQTRHIHIENHQTGYSKGYVWIGKSGLSGGGNQNTKPIIIYGATKELTAAEYRAQCIEKKFTDLLEDIGQKVAKSSTPTCFVSYAWHPKQDNDFHPLDIRVHQVAKYLTLAGLRVSLDLEQNHVGTSIGGFVQLIDRVDYVVWMGTKAVNEKC
ncbi:MAG: hypothetical protein ACK4M7_03650, partial [Burkholderiales bacterium]